MAFKTKIEERNFERLHRSLNEPVYNWQNKLNRFEDNLGRPKVISNEYIKFLNARRKAHIIKLYLKGESITQIKNSIGSDKWFVDKTINEYINTENR